MSGTAGSTETESSAEVARAAGEGGGMAADGQGVSFWGWEKYSGLVVMVAQFYEYTENH